MPRRAGDLASEYPFAIDCFKVACKRCRLPAVGATLVVAPVAHRVPLIGITRREHGDHKGRPYARGIGKTGFADAKAAGKITWISFRSTCVFTGAAPWFCPFTNLVGPYGIT